MPLRGLRRSPFTRPRRERRESKLRRSSWTRKSADSSSCPVRTVGTALRPVQRLEVLLDLPLEVARHLLPRDGFFHHLPVLPEHTHVLHARRHLGTAPEHVGIDAPLAARPRLPRAPGGRPARASPAAPRSKGLPLSRDVASPFGEVLLPRPGSRPSPSGKSPSSPGPPARRSGALSPSRRR